MADMIVCPVCGTENPPNQKTCQRCQSPLVSESAFTPGQSPVNMDTGELEPILPQWLRDARESAKLTEPPLEQKPTVNEAPPAKPKPVAASNDFLAGLQSQAGDDDEEDVPDWLASITGAAQPKPKHDEAEPSGIRWVETGKKDDFQQEAAAEEEVPSWLAGIQSEPVVEEKDELTEWFRETDAEQPSIQKTPAFDASFSPPVSDETPDWLKQMAADAGEKPEPPAETSFDTNDWFKQPAADTNAAPQSSSSTPDWLSQMSANAGSAAQTQSAEAFDLPADTPDWLNQMSAADASTVIQPATPADPFNQSAETPDWLSGLGGAAVFSSEAAPFTESAPVESEPFASNGDLPSWLAAEPEASKKVDSTPRWLQESEAQPAAPAWLAADENAGAAQPVEDAASASGDTLGDLPDWLKSAAPQTSIFDDSAPVTEMTAEPSQIEISKTPVDTGYESAPAFEKDSFSSQDDALFAEMPDWLSNAMETPSSASGVVPEPITGSDILAPNVLPSWVEAMRPTDENVMTNIVQASKDQTMESRGALAGLSGVLPMGTGFMPTSKPKSYSIKLNASDEQMKHAAILEQILAGETAPESLVSEKSLVASRGLRWALAAILILVAFATTFMRTQVFSTPLGIPSELGFAVAVAQAIPENAPVLVAVDYEPARAAEMEAAAAPLFDNLLLLKHPRLTFIASNENGSILAERFITGPLAVHNYQSGVTYLNLGYLSGGQMGIRAFAQSPSTVARLDINSQPAWAQQPLQDVTDLTKFAAIILITDSADAARSWVEQTEGSRGVVPVIVIAGAQASPMIQPYYESGQVAGMVSGLYGGAIIERQYNNGRPGMARNYWDAFSIGMLLAMVVTIGGGFLNLALGLRDRAAARGGK